MRGIEKDVVQEISLPEGISSIDHVLKVNNRANTSSDFESAQPIDFENMQICMLAEKGREGWADYPWRHMHFST